MRHGLTLVELLVVIGIVGVLTVLVLPAVAAARDAARSTQCRAKLSQIGVACSNYESSHGVFPSAGAHVAFGGVVPAAQFQLLPYLGAQNLFDATNASLLAQVAGYGAPQWSVANQTSGRLRVGAFTCPAENSYPGGTNYLACTGVQHYWMDYRGRRRFIVDPRLGSFRMLAWRRSSEFVRGTSRTAAFAERPMGDGERNWLDRRVDVIGGIAPWLAPEETFPEVCHRFDSLAGAWAPHFSHVGRNWITPGTGRTGYTHTLTPNSRVADCASVFSGLSGAITARSKHIGGVNIVYFDGHCETVSPSIDAEIWFRQSLVAEPN